MRQLRGIVPILVLAVILSACQMNKQTAGTGLGGIGGGIAGAQFGKGKGQIATTIVGTLLGAYLGGEVGKSLDRADAAYAQQQAIPSALEYGRGGYQQAWQNPDTGRGGYVTPQRAYGTTESPCRHYTFTIEGADGHAYQGEGDACRVNGQWQSAGY